MINNKLIRPDWWRGETSYMRDGFGEALVELGEQMEDLLVLTADLGSSLRLEAFKEKFSKRYFNVGVAEQNMLGLAAGLAAEGWKPVTTSFAVFSPGRSWDQIRVSVAYSEANVKIVGSHGGIATGEDGATHQALEDVALMQVLPNVVVLAPSDESQAKMATKAMLVHQGPVYLRLVRPKVIKLTKEVPFEIGKAYIYREGGDVSLFTYGIQVGESLNVAEELSQEGVEVEVVNVATLKPLDKEVIIKSAAKTKRVVVIEDHQVIGGLGSEVARLLISEGLSVQFKQIGMKDCFGESGNWRDLYRYYGLDKESLKEEIKLLFED